MRKVIDYYMRNNGSQHIVEHIGAHESGDLLIGQLFETSENGYRQHPYDFHQQYEKIDKSVVDALERQTCPQRTDGMHGFEKTEGIDFWKVQENGHKKCSYCGSLHPSNVLDVIRANGFRAVHRVKNYKWYVGDYDKYYLWHNTPDFVDQYNNLVSAIDNK